METDLLQRQQDIYRHRRQTHQNQRSGQRSLKRRDAEHSEKSFQHRVLAFYDDDVRG